MARVTFTKPHLLLLDEPSNHLDMDAVAALVEVSRGWGWGGWQGHGRRRMFRFQVLQPVMWCEVPALVGVK